MTISRQLAEATEAPSDTEGTQGTYKVGTEMLRSLDMKSDQALFRQLRIILAKKPSEEWSRLFGKKAVEDAKELLSKRPRQAFHVWLKKVHTVHPKLGAFVTENPGKASLAFYMVMRELLGRELADSTFRRHFGPGKGAAPKMPGQAGPIAPTSY